MTEYHSVRAFAREEPRIELIEATLRSLLKLVDLEFEGEPAKVDGFRLRNLDDWRTAPETSLQVNLGSLSTTCNCRCEFCYESGNPPDLFAREPRFVGLQEARTRARHLRDGHGLPPESKGMFEALCNPHFLDLTALMRRHDPEGLIDLITNGAQLTEELIAKLAALQPILVHLSLNSADAHVRGALMADRRASRAIRAPQLLRAYGIPFVGSLVPWPEQGLEDLVASIEYLDEQEARMVRIAAPALTRYHPRFTPELLREWLPKVLGCVQELRGRLATPVIVTPFTHVTSSFEPVVEGVVRRSPAAAAGVMLGDRILTIDGRQVVSRSHASSLLERAVPVGRVLMEIGRGGRVFEAALEAPDPGIDHYPYQPLGYERLHFPGTLFGLCLPGSFHLSYLKRAHEEIVARRAKRTLLLVSAHFRRLVADLVAGLPLPPGAEIDLLTPANRYFGGDVDIADLWVIEDVAAALDEQARSTSPADLLIMPSSFLSRWGRDLLGVPYTALESAFGLQVALVPTERIGL